jgi:hypothetical protein
MDNIRGNAPDKEKKHEQDHPHQKAQRSAILCNGTGLFGIVRGTAGV